MHLALQRLPKNPGGQMLAISLYEKNIMHFCVYQSYVLYLREFTREPKNINQWLEFYILWHDHNSGAGSGM